MAESTLFKDRINIELCRHLAGLFKQHYRDFPRDQFIKSIKKDIENLAFKDRIKLVSNSLNTALPKSYKKAATILKRVITSDDEHGRKDDYGSQWWPIGQWVEDYGADEFEITMDLIYELTQRFTGEFAIRPLLERYPEQALDRLNTWAKDENFHIRRLVSEGTRTRLPWGKRLDQFIEDPQPVLQLLEIMKDAPEMYVKKSIANNLNDIGKDHPELLVKTCERWNKNASKDRKWIIKHALRSLIKAGHPGALKIVGYKEQAVEVLQFSVAPKSIKMGEAVEVTAELKNPEKKSADYLVDYVMHFTKANGKQAPKVFKWTTKSISAGSKEVLKKKHKIVPITTRKYYSGKVGVSLQINGKAIANAEFDLKVD